VDASCRHRRGWGKITGSEVRMVAPGEPFRDALKDRYRIDREIGRGGMAIVYRAHDLKHGHDVALKVLRPELSAEVGTERFLREIRVMSGLTHPYILPLLDSGVAAETPYYVMPLIEGESLRDRLTREGPLPVEQGIRICREIAEALDYAHQQGVVHRDLKPDNVLLSEGHAVVADFGIARAIGQAAGDRLTSTGVVLGTPAYMGPEQAMGFGVIDGRADIYSLGCMLYEVLAGQAPYSGPTVESLIHQHVSAPVPDVKLMRPSVPTGVQATIERAMAKAPADRYSTAGEMGTALGGVEPSAAGTVAGDTSTPVSTRVETVGSVRTGPVVKAPGSGRGGRGTLLISCGAIAVVVIVGLVLARAPMEKAFRQSKGAPAERQWILVPEFEGPPDNPQLAVGIRELICAALDQSEVAMTVPRDQIARVLHTSGRSDTTRVDASLGRELAIRRSVRTVLEGRVTRVGAALSIVLRLVDAETGKLVFSESGVAPNEAQLVRTLDGIVRRVRGKLGESHAAIASNRPLDEITTPSLDAYQRILEGDALVEKEGFRDLAPALARYRQALAIDPDCADAYIRMATLFHDAARFDSAVWALNQALLRPDRLDEAKRLLIVGSRANTMGDLQGASEAFDRLLELYPNSPLADEARREAAVAKSMVGGASSRPEPGRPLSAVILTDNDAGVAGMVLALQGQIVRSDSILSTIDKDKQPFYRCIASLLSHSFRRADSIATLMEDRAYEEALLTHAIVRANRGAFQDADAYLGRAPTRDPSRIHFLNADLYQYRLEINFVGGTSLPARPLGLARDSSAYSVYLQGFHAALATRLTDAHRLHASLLRCQKGELGRLGAAPTFLEALIAHREGRWGDVISELADVARRGHDIGYLRWNRVGPAMERWLVADAYERSSQPDSAAVFFERVTEHPPVNDRTPALILENLAHLRLAILYASMGRRVDAERHLSLARLALTEPDPPVVHLMAAASDAVQRLQ
jgi:tRNA A-37 threonylcarbamoyl transferase component Bud32/tetratricopeptide (TPR) repeat protein/TolB-like protein